MNGVAAPNTKIAGSQKVVRIHDGCNAATTMASSNIRPPPIDARSPL
jgi:hypothetical protein